MNKILLSAIIIGTVIMTIVSYNVYLNLSTIYSGPSTIHVVISPIVNDPDYPYGAYAEYYDDYFDPPTSYWKKSINYSNNTDILVNCAIADAQLVSSPVVIVAPKWFEPYFVNVTNAEGQPVEYQWYG